MVRQKSVRMIWLDETKIWSVWSPSKGSDWTRRKMVRLKSVRRIWLDEKESGSYDDASDLYVLPEWSDWTRRNLVLSSGNASDWLTRSICLLSSSFDFFWLLVSRFHTAIRDWQESIREMHLLSATITPFNLLLTRKTDKTTVTFVTYSTRGGVLKLCTMPMMWLGKCVRLVLVVNIMIHN